MPSRPELYQPDGQIDWDSLRADYNSRCSETELQSQEEIARGHITIPKTSSPTAGMSRSVEPRKVTPRMRELIKDYYMVGNRVPWIAGEMELSEATVRKLLTDMEVYDPHRDKGRS